jgi:hypothetical protein
MQPLVRSSSILSKLSLMAFVVGLSSCGKPDPSLAELDAFTITLSRNLVTAKLKDPKSAEFSEERVSHTSGRGVACGKVNSRNSFGGMTGSQRFVSAGSQDSTFLEEEMAPGTMDETWRRFC